MILPFHSDLSIEESVYGGVSSKENWEKIKEKIISFYGEVVFRSWFRSVNFSCYDSGAIFLTVSSRFIRDWIKTNYLDFVLKAWRELDKRVTNIDLIIGDAKKSDSIRNINSNSINSNENSIVSSDQIDNHVSEKNSFYNIIIDTKDYKADVSDKALAVRKNYGFEDIVENFQDLASDFENQKLKKAKNPQKKEEKSSIFQQNLSLIDSIDDRNYNSESYDKKISILESQAIFQPQIIEKNLNFDERFTFDNFVKDDSNELAFFAAKAFAENKKIANFNCNQNPLFLYGGVGLGKTHLIHAIANHKIQNLRAQFPYDWEKKAREKIIYSSSERFMREFLSALRNRDTKAFKDKFRNVDILMIDDIQFLNGKGCTQEEFFHIFLNLMLNGKQLVISADRIPSALVGMEERLKSRLGCGIVADIRNGDFNFRLNVLKKKAYSMNTDFQNSVLEFLAQNIHSSIRELEGALNKLVMMRSLNSSRIIDVPFVREKLADMLTHNHEILENAYVLSKKSIKFNDVDATSNANNINNIKNIQQLNISSDDNISNKNNLIYEIQLKVAEHYKLQVSDLISNSRVKKVVLPKQIAMFLARKMTSESLAEIARQFGGKDHSTIIYGCNKIEEMIKKDSLVSEEVNKLIILLKK